MKFVSGVTVAALLGGAAPVWAQTAAEVDCGYQAAVVEAVRQARIERVKERKVPEHVAASAPTWPEKYNAVVPLVAPWVYEMKMRDVKANDLGAAWNEMCLAR
ncbi:hypothetical protein [Roseobacter sp. GAI101]|uniref:hypothetical protein n=1 Tax=Roseobacter sp. (strain GAI101) TaxID=391589 RepID=UPI00056116E9|nr:hypothetical protein [Roseobacter sp. GAI101]